jgi:transcriptional regulator with XRE-family HTH domain
MSDIISLGLWIKRRRKALDLTQAELAQRVGCSLDLIQKIEADTRRPSREMAGRIADMLELAAAERAPFMQAARAELGADRLAPPTQSIARGAFVPAQAMSSAGDPPGHRPPMPPTNLPAPLTQLIGRKPAIAAVRAALLRGETRLLTLIGPPGIGKTRLSLAVAHDVQDAFSDG